MFMDRFLPAYQAELEVFAELVAADRVSPCTVADALAADLIAEACGLSLREHRPVGIDEVKP
jgi:myo-inositol 2-dehydrogenase / D-chiro-inositol 1-dehydrogenase